jgi:hypothetical protein
MIRSHRLVRRQVVFFCRPPVAGLLGSSILFFSFEFFRFLEMRFLDTPNPDPINFFSSCSPRRRLLTVSAGVVIFVVVVVISLARLFSYGIIALDVVCFWMMLLLKKCRGAPKPFGSMLRHRRRARAHSARPEPFGHFSSSTQFSICSLCRVKLAPGRRRTVSSNNCLQMIEPCSRTL